MRAMFTRVRTTFRKTGGLPGVRLLRHGPLTIWAVVVALAVGAGVVAVTAGARTPADPPGRAVGDSLDAVSGFRTSLGEGFTYAKNNDPSLADWAANVARLARAEAVAVTATRAPSGGMPKQNLSDWRRTWLEVAAAADELAADVNAGDWDGARVAFDDVRIGADKLAAVSAGYTLIDATTLPTLPTTLAE